jgi:hypothetical protein
MFRTKKPKKQDTRQRVTLDDMHALAVESFRTDGLERELECCTDASQKEQLEKEIVRLQDARKNYYLTNGRILLDYYDPSKQTAVSLNTFFLGSSAAPASAPSTGKKYLLDRYLRNTDPRHVSEYDTQDADSCQNCGGGASERCEYTDGMVVCGRCGTQQDAITVSDLPNYKDAHTERSTYNYQRINHFAEIVGQVQARQNTTLNPDLLESVRLELKKLRVTDVTTVSVEMMLSILKKLGYDDKYDHVQLILIRIGARPQPPPIADHIIEHMNKLFNLAQSRWFMHKPPDRRNFLAYHYVVYKIFELEGLHLYKDNCRLLRTRDKLLEYDAIWKKICADCNWQYIPT